MCGVCWAEEECRLSAVRSKITGITMWLAVEDLLLLYSKKPAKFAVIENKIRRGPSVCGEVRPPSSAARLCADPYMLALVLGCTALRRRHLLRWQSKPLLRPCLCCRRRCRPPSAVFLVGAHQATTWPWARVRAT